MQDTVFDKILRREIPARMVYENEYVLAFHDIFPKAPVHILLIPKTKIESLNATDPTQEIILGQLLLATKQVAELSGIIQLGYRVVINTGPDADQTVFYLRAHVLAGKKMDASL